MNNYSYGKIKDTKSVKLEMIDIINKVQKELKEQFTFRHDFAGASKYAMILSEVERNIGFEFDADIILQGDFSMLQPKEIKQKLVDTFGLVLRELHAGTCSNHTAGFVVSLKDDHIDKLLHSCNFIVLTIVEGKQVYLNQNKDKGTYWQEVTDEFIKLPLKEEWLKNNGQWQEVRDLYLEKKNRNRHNRKDSRTLYLETIQEISEEYRYQE